MTTPHTPQLRISDPAGLLAVIPHLLGFTPEDSLIVLGLVPPAGRVHVLFRYDLPDPPAAELAPDIAQHAIAVLASHHMSSLAVVGYGPGHQVTPLVDA